MKELFISPNHILSYGRFGARDCSILSATSLAIPFAYGAPEDHLYTPDLINRQPPSRSEHMNMCVTITSGGEYKGRPYLIAFYCPLHYEYDVVLPRTCRSDPLVC